MKQIIRRKIIMDEFRYKLISTGESSGKYGKCDVCGEHCTEVFHQLEEKHYHFEHDGEVFDGWTKHEAHDYFGHENCLTEKRR